jgi:hypothetical protein
MRALCPIVNGDRNPGHRRHRRWRSRRRCGRRRGRRRSRWFWRGTAGSEPNDWQRKSENLAVDCIHTGRSPRVNSYGDQRRIVTPVPWRAKSRPSSARSRNSEATRSSFRINTRRDSSDNSADLKCRASFDVKNGDCKNSWRTCRSYSRLTGPSFLHLIAEDVCARAGIYCGARGFTCAGAYTLPLSRNFVQRFKQM